MGVAKLKKCKECGSGFVPQRPLQYLCSPICAINYTRKQTEKKIAKDWQKEKKERKTALMSRKDWLDLAQKVFNTFIRKRDQGKPCYMCQKPINGVIHACHYLNQGNHSFVRFHEDNVWAGCYSCNVMLSGNLIEFRKVLLKTIGEERLQWLEDNGSQVKKWEIEEIKEIIKIYKEKTKQLKNENT